MRLPAGPALPPGGTDAASLSTAAPVPGVPVAFKGMSGFFHPAGGEVGVVMCSPWGFEELSMRKGWRLLAEAVGGAGYPCLRFDYPGCGNSLGSTAEVASVEEWIEAVHRAAEFLRFKSGARRFVFLGQSLGATLAATAAAARRDVDGLVLIAPVTSGRAYARELAATGAMVAQRLGAPHAITPAEAVSVVGFPLSRALVDSFKLLALPRIDRLEGVNATVFDQTGRRAGAEMLSQLRRAGAAADLEPVAPYHLLVSDAIAVQPLPAAAERVVAALERAHPVAAPQPASAAFTSSVLTGPGFQEEPLRFGPAAPGDAGTLFGVLCQPLRRSGDTAAVVLLNRGLNPHVGWRRVSVDHARALASAGISSLRIDVGGIGESPDVAGRTGNLIYSDLLLADIRAAVDELERRGYRRIALAGVCSGAYLALQAARADRRVTDVFSVNPQRLVWNPAESPDELIRYGLRSMNDYLGDVRAGGALRKLVRARHRVVPAARFLLRQRLRQLVALVPAPLRATLLPFSMAVRVRAAFETLAAAGTRVALVYSAADPGLDELTHCFGDGGRDLRLPGASVSIVPDADHNLTATAASDRMLGQLLEFMMPAPASPEAAPPRANRPRAALAGQV